ncbi:MAG: J domain-containing protein [Actinomycetota bacterium]
MNKQAFAILGIQPTDDGRVIRSAFLRLARIYHPDRFVDMPDDVRAEAERRMKEATIAYESLRTKKPADEAPPVVIDDEEIHRRAAVYREAADKKKKMDEYDRARWRSWEAAEKRARDKARMEADIASRLEDEMNGFRVPSDGKPTTEVPEPEALTAKKRSSKSRLNERIDAARRGETNPLVPQPGAGS